MRSCHPPLNEYRLSRLFTNKGFYLSEMIKRFCNVVSTIFLLHSGVGSWFPSPHFVDTPTNVTVKEGNHAFLPCKVANLGDRSVTWMRKKNLHIISAGILTYSPDNRYKVLHPTNTNEWTLQIRSVNKADHGFYECQVNSDPKITRHFFLSVRDKNLDDPFYRLEMELKHNNTNVSISGPYERYIQSGSILQVSCIINHEPNQGPKKVRWFHGATRIDYSSPRGGILLETEKTLTKTVSKLRLSGVVTSDSGRYSCKPDNGGATSVSVHVLSGQFEAVVQQSDDDSKTHNTQGSSRFLVSYLVFSHIILNFFLT